MALALVLSLGLSSNLEGGDVIYGVKLADLGNALEIDTQDDSPYEIGQIQTREYRCVESMLGIKPYMPQADVWSVGCVFFELFTGQYLFEPQLPPDMDIEDVGGDKHLARIAFGF